MIKNILKGLGIPENACRAYIHLLDNGPSPARQIAESLNIPRPSIYDNLKILIAKGLINEQDRENKTLFLVGDVENISRLLEEQANNLKSQGEELRNLLPDLKKQSDYLEPKVKFYNGSDGLKRAINEILWHENIETYCIWPMSEMLKVLGEDYLNDLNKKRIRKKISLKVIWPQDKTVDFKKFKFLGVGEKFLRDLRLAPKNASWDMGFWLYADKIIFISSRRESFGFVVHSRDFSNLMKTQFSMIWPLCQKVSVNPKDTEEFLETII